MLLNFTVKNYKSFVEENTFSMIAAQKQKGLDYSVFATKKNNKILKILSSSVIYGPNASGKTNIIGAMDTFRSIVLRGNIRNEEERESPNEASTNLELIPNNQLKEASPVELSVEFLENDIKVKYSISLDLGYFLDNKEKRRIISEVLIVDDKLAFERLDNTLKIEYSQGALRNFSVHDMSKQNDIMELLLNSINPDELFLTNGFRLFVSQDLAKLIIDWFANKFMVIYRADSMHLIRRFSEPEKKTIYIEKTINDAASIFGLNSNGVGYIASDDENKVKLYSLFNNEKGEKSLAIASEIYESFGTIRFINIFPLVIRAIKTGGVLVVDEFDASIHPMALMSIINIFHNDDININHAQLIFNTHNPIFLNSNLFRRDEIKFVERDDKTHNSTIYSLSDFGTSGANAVRKHEDYMKNYFVSRYGAIKDIDFTPVFENLLNASDEED